MYNTRASVISLSQSRNTPECKMLSRALAPCVVIVAFNPKMKPEKPEKP